MNQLKTTWTVAYFEDHGSPVKETAKGVSKEEATIEVRRIRDTLVACRIYAEVFDDCGTRIARHGWVKDHRGVWVYGKVF